MGVLVQSSPPAGRHRIYSACRSGGKLLSATRRARHFRGVNLNQMASTKPGAIHSGISLKRNPYSSGMKVRPRHYARAGPGPIFQTVLLAIPSAVDLLLMYLERLTK